MLSNDPDCDSNSRDLGRQLRPCPHSQPQDSACDYPRPPPLQAADSGHSSQTDVGRKFAATKNQQNGGTCIDECRIDGGNEPTKLTQHNELH